MAHTQSVIFDAMMAELERQAKEPGIFAPERPSIIAMDRGGLWIEGPVDTLALSQAIARAVEQL
jgi:hypothetical protein